VHVTVKELLVTYRKQVGKSEVAAVVAVSSAVFAACALLARQGSSPFRVFAAVGLALLFCAWLALLKRRRDLRAERHALRLVLRGDGPTLARASRALELSLTAPTQPGVSAELAALHYDRTLRALDVNAIGSRAHDVKRRLIAAALMCALGISAVALALPHQVSEGANVLLARDGLAPFPSEWLEYVSLEAKLPAYLGSRTTLLSWESAVSLPEGTTLSVRGRPLHEGRTLVLWDGETEVPFVDDGEGQTVAHWVVTSAVELRIGARFGNVLILEPGSVGLSAEPDDLPKVTLLMERRDVLLEDSPQIDVRFRVLDDHQISQVDLVLRALGREERRTLDRPAPGNSRIEGGYVLRADDPFLEKAFVPVIVRIEARDNKPERSLEEWGRSETLILRPREVGGAQVQRLTALQGTVERLVDVLAALERSTPEQGALPAQALKDIRERLDELRKDSLEVTERTYSSLAVPRGMTGFVRAQFEKVLAAFVSPRGDKKRALERIILALDAANTALAKRDAQEVSKALGDVADEMAFAARAAQSGEGDRLVALERLDLAISVLGQGAERLRQLGVLGLDLGSVASADLRRVTTSRATDDFFHAELAALHMAARLHRPNPSFGSKGGGGSAGVEGGDGGAEGEGTAAEDAPASDADEQFDRMAKDVQELTQEHGQAVERSASALDSAEQSLENDPQREEAKRRADALRHAVELLPQPGESPSTSRASAALAREHAIAMAHELEDLSFEQAVENGQRAKSAAEEALRRGDLDSMTQEATRMALNEISAQLEWAAQRRAQWRAQKEQAAKEALQEVSRYEQELGERASRLVSEGQQSQSALPEEAVAKLRDAVELMRHAAQQLGTGQGQQGLNLQRHAQRLLEEAQLGETKGNEPKREGQNGKAAGFGGDVPKDTEGAGAQEFRRRVLEGLARSGGGRLAPAVKRYAEGLLR
jgi:hypothetical protein